MKMTVASPTPFQTSTRATEKMARLRVGQPAGPVNADDGQRLVDKAVLRVHQDGERESDADGADQHREEDRPSAGTRAR